MKQLILFIFLMTLSFGEGHFTNYEEALAEAKKTDKLLMVVVEQEHCPWCHRFKERTLEDFEVEILTDEYFIMVFLDKNKDKISKSFEVPVTPVTFIVDKNGKTLNETIGYVNKFRFLDTINEILAEIKDR